MISHELIENAGLTEGESKVYLALLGIGQSTAGPIIKKSGVANSIIYKILDSLIEKGLVSFITKEKTKYFQAANPHKIVDYIEEKKEQLEEDKLKVESLLPQLIGLAKPSKGLSIQVFEGFKGFITAWETMYSKLGKGDEYHCFGGYVLQEERFHSYWKRDHIRRKKAGIKSRMLFNKGTLRETLENRNTFWECDSRYMPSDVKTPAFFTVFKDTTMIQLQTLKNVPGEELAVEKPVAIIIENKEIAETFDAYFMDYWKKSKPFRK